MCPCSVAQLCPALCDTMDCILQGSSVHRIFHTRTLAAAAAKSLQSCQTLCDPIDSSPPGSPIPGILHARTLEWVAISSRVGLLFLPQEIFPTQGSNPHLLHWQVGSLLLEYQGSPIIYSTRNQFNNQTAI